MTYQAAIDYAGAMRLDGKGLVVLGAGQGIGLETTLALAQQGATILCVDRDEELARKAANAVGGRHAVADVTSETEVKALFDHAGELFGARFAGFVDIVGRADLRPLCDFSEEEWDGQFSLLLKHAFFSLKHAAGKFGPDGGTVVFVSSLSSFRNLKDQGVYGAAKAALNHLIGSAALELGPRNIRVNGVAPGLTKTPRLEATLGDTRMSEIAKVIPLRRFGHPSDIAATILFLTSSLSNSISGAVVPVDGGITNLSIFPDLNVGAGFLNAGKK